MITNHCEECGDEVEESCQAHPKAAVVCIRTPDAVPALREIKRDAEFEGRTEEAAAIEEQVQEEYRRG